MTRTMTLRLSDELAADLRLVARLDGVSGAEVSRIAIEALVRERLGDPAARARLSEMQEADRKRLEQRGS